MTYAAYVSIVFLQRYPDKWHHDAIHSPNSREASSKQSFPHPDAQRRQSCGSCFTPSAEHRNRTLSLERVCACASTHVHRRSCSWNCVGSNDAMVMFNKRLTVAYNKLLPLPPASIHRIEGIPSVQATPVLGWMKVHCPRAIVPSSRTPFVLAFITKYPKLWNSRAAGVWPTICACVLWPCVLDSHVQNPAPHNTDCLTVLPNSVYGVQKEFSQAFTICWGWLMYLDSIYSGSTALDGSSWNSCKALSNGSLLVLIVYAG